MARPDPERPRDGRSPEDGLTFTLFEVVNETTREVYVTATVLPLSIAFERIRQQPPSGIAHWRREDRISFKSLEFSLRAQEAAGAVKKRLESALPDGWRYLTGGPF